MVIQKWWKSKKNTIKNVAKKSEESKEIFYEQMLKRKKLKHSFSFGMENNYNPVQTQESNAMFGCINSKDNPICMFY